MSLEADSHLQYNASIPLRRRAHVRVQHFRHPLRGAPTVLTDTMMCTPTARRTDPHHAHIVSPGYPQHTHSIPPACTHCQLLALTNTRTYTLILTLTPSSCTQYLPSTPPWQLWQLCSSSTPAPQRQRRPSSFLPLSFTCDLVEAIFDVCCSINDAKFH